MSTTLNDTMDTAKSMMDSAKNETQHAVSSARSTLFDGIRAAASVASMLRSFELSTALGWIGLARRRGPFESFALFGAGAAVGTAVGMLFAPMSGADTRRAIFGRLKGLGQDAQRTIEKAEAGAKEIEQKIETKAEDLAGKAKDAAMKAERKVETTVSAGLDTAKEAVKGKVESATSAIKETAEDAKSALTSADPMRQTGGDNNKNPGAMGNHRQSQFRDH
jgi:gas vesicle protein